MSQAIIRSPTDKIALYDKSGKACCADDVTPEDMLPDYYTFKTYFHLHNRYTTLGDTTNIPIEGIVTDIYTLNGK